jgi:methyl-accepting chemotaxis protein
MKRMSLFLKLICANVLYAIPVIALIFFMVAAQNVNIDFGAQEIKGNLFQRPAEILLEKLTSARFSESFEKNIEESLTATNELQNALKLVGEDLQFTPEGLKKRNREQVEFSSFNERLKKLNSQIQSMSKDQKIEALNSLIVDVRTMIGHSGDTSNLILDPDLDSYYLMDITLLALPQAQDRISEILAYLKDLPNELSSEQQVKVAVYEALFKQSDVDRITADLQTTLNEDAQFYGVSPTLQSKLKPAIDEFSKSSEAFIQSLGKIATSGKFSNRLEVFKSGQLAFSQSFTSWKLAVEELDILLNNRIAVLRAERTKSLAYALMALAFAIMVLFWISSNFNSNMRKVIESLKTVVSETNTAGQQLVTLSEQLSSVSADQASAIHETSSAVTEIESMTRATLSNVASSKELSETSSEKTQEAFETMKTLSAAIAEISQANGSVTEQMDQSLREMVEITKIISQIGTKTQVINEIVFQTKLLSFNASVEAARAGEYGKGFAVVAEEVGNLAKMSGSASSEISQMLDTSITNVNSMSQNTNDRIQRVVSISKEKITIGNQLANECSHSLDEIQSRVTTILQTSLSILQAATEQSKGIEEVSKAIVRIEELSQQNMNMSRQTADQSLVLSRQTQALNEISEIVQSVVMGSASSYSAEAKLEKTDDSDAVEEAA